MEALFKKYFYIFFFFTVWNFILVVFHQYTHKYFELLYLSFMTFMVGMYFTTVNPKRFVFYYGDKTLVIDKWFYLFITDAIFHFGVFIFVFFKYYKYYKSIDTNMPLFASTLLLIIYICMFKPNKIYGIEMIEIIIVVSAVNLLYFIIL